MVAGSNPAPGMCFGKISTIDAGSPFRATKTSSSMNLEALEVFFLISSIVSFSSVMWKGSLFRFGFPLTPFSFLTFCVLTCVDMWLHQNKIDFVVYKDGRKQSKVEVLLIFFNQIHKLLNFVNFNYQ